MNGDLLVRYVRKQKTPRHVPMLVVSDAKGGYQKNQALSAGADLFYGKPIAVEELVRAVGNAFNNMTNMSAIKPASSTPASQMGAAS